MWLEGWQGLIIRIPPDWGKQTLLLEAHTRSGYTTRLKEKAEIGLIGVWVIPTTGIGRSSVEAGGIMAAMETKTSVALVPGVLVGMSPLKATIFSPKHRPTQKPAGSSAGMPQANRAEI